MRRRISWPFVLVVLATVGVCVIAYLLAPRSQDGMPLSPDNPSPDGSRAVAQVLHQHGVMVHNVQDLSAAREHLHGRRSTLVISNDEGLSQADLNGLVEAAGDARIVVVQPSDGTRARLFPATDASRAGVVYPVDTSGPRIVVNDPDVLANGTITQGDHARIALRALGSTPEVVWVSDWQGRAAAGEAQGLAWPPWVRPLVWSLVLTVVFLIVTRGRRFGRLVTEPLPVVVRAIESTRALGTIYRRHSARDAAAAALVAGTSARLRRHLALPPARRAPEASAREIGEIQQIIDALPEQHRESAQCLLSRTPQSEQELVELAERLAHLEKEVTGE